MSHVPDMVSFHPAGKLISLIVVLPAGTWISSDSVADVCPASTVRLVSISVPFCNVALKWNIVSTSTWFEVVFVMLINAVLSLVKKHSAYCDDARSKS